MSELDTLLGDLKSAGKLDSAGRFTLDLEKARAKLAKYRLPSPSHFILSLLASAVAGKARSFEVRRKPGFCQVHYDGQVLNFEEAKDLFGNLLLGDSGAGLRLRELAIALQGARSFDLLGFTVESWDGRAGVRLSLHQETMTVDQIDGCPWPEAHLTGTRCTVYDNAPLLVKFRSFFTRDGGALEVTLLKRQGRYAATKVMVNARKLNSNKLGPWLVAAEIGSKSVQVAEMKVTAQKTLKFPPKTNWGGYLGFGEGPGGWLLILNGLTFQVAPDPQNYPTSRAVVYVNDLEKDLSNNGILGNERFHKLQESVNKQLDRLVAEVTSMPSHADLKAAMKPLNEIRRQRRG